MSFTCPKCKAVSHNPNDEQQKYCGWCREFVGPMVPTRKCPQCQGPAVLRREWITAERRRVWELLDTGIKGSSPDMPIKYFEWKCLSETCSYHFCVTLEDLLCPK